MRSKLSKQLNYTTNKSKHNCESLFNCNQLQSLRITFHLYLRALVDISKQVSIFQLRFQPSTQMKNMNKLEEEKLISNI